MKKIALLTLLSLGAVNLHAQADCEHPATVGPGIHSVSFEAGSQVPSLICTTGGTGATMAAWYAYMPSEAHTVTVTSDVPTFPIYDTRVHIYSGTCGNLTCVAGDDDGGTGSSSLVTFNVQPGVTYYIVFDNRYNSADFSFSLTETVFVQPMFSAQGISVGGFYKLCVVDMNGDYLDDVVSVNDSHVEILYQQENGLATTPVIASLPMGTHMPGWSMAAGDLDRNGYTDLVLGSTNGASVVLANDDGTAFTQQIQSGNSVFSQRTNMIDINNDGNLDVFVCHDVAPNVFFMNDGAGNYNYQQGGLGDYPSGGNYGSIWVDYDNDGDADLFIAKCRGGMNPAAIDELHRNNGDGTFTNVAEEANLAGGYHQSWSSAWADFDNDGDMDVLVGASSDEEGSHKLMRNNGDGTFTNVTDGSGYDTFFPMNIEHVAHDFNNDGFVDVMSGGNSVMINNGDMTFTPIAVNCNNGAIGDLNNDGFLDVQNGNTIYYNTGNDNNWLKIHLKGVESNANGIGARVEIYGAWGKQIRDVRSGDGFKYMSSLNTHFGLGEAAEIEKLVVKWPSGTVDTILNPDVNTSVLVTEGNFVLGINSPVSNLVSLYPNPARDILNVSGIEAAEAKIYDLGGRLVKTVDVTNATVPVHSLAKGTYILVLKDSTGKSHTSKFIKG